MAIKSYRQELEEVQAAIGAIEGGAQQYSIGGRSLTRANLAELYNREKFLRMQVDREDNGGIRVGYIIW